MSETRRLRLAELRNLKSASEHRLSSLAMIERAVAAIDCSRDQIAESEKVRTMSYLDNRKALCRVTLARAESSILIEEENNANDKIGVLFIGGSEQ